MEAAPSWKRPWLTSVICGPNVMASITVPSAAKIAMASPDFESEKPA